jgi:RNA polymerase sigma-B factor
VIEIAADLGEDPQLVRQAVGAHAYFATVSLDSAVSDGDDPRATTVGEHEAGFLAAEARAMLHPALRRLDSDDRRVLALRFDRGLSQRDIGAVLGMSQMQVSRILRRILRELRAALESQATSAVTSA